MKKILSLLSLAALTVGLLGSCSKIDERISNLEKRVDGIESTSIASVQQQIDGIKASITKLEAADVTVNGKIDELKATAETHQTLIDALKEADKALGQKDTELESRIAALEGQVATINGQIKTLEEADKAINDRIDELKTYVDTEIGKTKDWAEETFATLEQYQQTADDLAALSVTVTGISTTLAEVQTSIAGLDTKIDGIDADLQGKITAAKTELEGKITSLKTELEGKIAEAISSSETSIKSWINELLEGYYTIAQVDAKIGSLNTAIETAKSTSKTRIDSVATELTALKKVVDTEKAAIRTEYKNAIDVAINKLDGEIRGALKDSVVAVNGRIATLDTRVTTLELKMQAVEDRVDKLEKAIGAYTELQGTITEIIKKLIAEVGDKPKDQQDTTIWKCITALQAQCGTFSTAIQTLQGLVGNKDVATQISEAIASLISTQKLDGLADAVSKLKDIVDVNVNDVKSLTQQIADINTALSTTYVTKTQLGQDIATAKADLQKQIDSLCNVIGKDGNTTTATGIFKKIADLNAKVAALEAVKITIESTEYTNWSDAVQAVLNKVNALGIGNISGLQSALNDLDARLDKIEAMIQSVTILPAYTDGSVEAEEGTLTIDFVVSPAAAVKGVTKDSIKVLVHQAKVQTKAASYESLSIESADVNEATGDVTITANISKITPAEGKALTVAVNVKNGISDFTTEFVPVTVAAAKPTVEYVEIGGLKWATMNLGAEKVTDCGDYFAWGEKAPYYEGTGGWPTTPTWKSGKESGYTWQSYCASSSFSEWSTPPYDATTKILKPEFDAAAQILGDGWRMPTSAEFKALYDACGGSYDKTTNPGKDTSVGKGVYWCTSYDGVAGCLFCDGTNKLFFPAAGYGSGTSLKSAGTGYYWSSSCHTSSTSYAYELVFNSSTILPKDNSNRYSGYSVRPVKDAEPEYVEIGGVKWATKNLGAEKETDYGDYFAWGATELAYSSLSSNTFTFVASRPASYGGSGWTQSSGFANENTPYYDGSAYTKYTSSDSKTVLESSDDAATALLGSGWRMPTSAEFQALYDACGGSCDKTTNPGKDTSVGKGVYWCTSYDGVAGCLFCDGTNKLFFPAAGCGSGTSLKNAGSFGYYWSGSLHTGNTISAKYLVFYSGYVSPQSFTIRYNGYSVRPVTTGGASDPGNGTEQYKSNSNPDWFSK